MTAQSAGPTRADLRLRASRWAQGSFWMLVVFALWTVAFVVGSGPVARRRGCGTIAWVGIGMNLAVMAAVVAPATIDRLVNL